MSSEKVNLSRSEGKVILINFWATWCPPCVAEMPYLQKLYETYKDEVDFYFVTSEVRDKLQLFLDKKGYDIPVYIPLEREPDLLENTSLPTTFLISQTGEIIIRKVGAASWNNEAIHELLDELLDQ
jgi:Thiol-disulfide isomerase and thioredoxins